jgi:hypothetical protein
MKLDPEIKRALAYYIVMKHQIEFENFFGPIAWQKPFKVRYYQYGYTIADDCVVYGGRSFGKSITLEFNMAQNAINIYNEESLLTTFRRMHIKDRFEKVISYFTRIPYFRKFLKGAGDKSTKESITRTPFYDIHLRNGHSLKGISVGDDPLAVAIQGTHPVRRYIDETQMFPREAWVKFQSTRDPKGSNDKYFGCCDGRITTPYYELEKSRKFKNKRFHVPRLYEPYFNQEDKFNLIQTLGSENSNEYLQQVLALHGEPEWAVWPEESIRACIDKTEVKVGTGILSHHIDFITISAKDYKDSGNPMLFLQSLKIPKGVTETILAIDAGYSEPTVVLPFMRINHKWHLYTIIELIDRMIPDDQTEIIDYIANFYNAMIIPIDCTSADGRAVASSLQNPKREEYKNKNYDKRVIWVEFNKYFEVGKRINEKTQEEEPIKEKVKDKTTTVLRQMFANQDFFMYYSEELLVQFNAESQRRTSAGRIEIKTPDWVHIPEAFRCFAAAYYEKYMNVKPEIEEDEYGEMAHAENIELNFTIFSDNKDRYE